jgi:hypothetical protein
VFLRHPRVFNNSYKQILITRPHPLWGGVELKTRAILAIALVGLMIGSVLAAMPAADAAKALSEKNKTLYIHTDGSEYWMNLDKSSSEESGFSSQSNGAEIDCPMNSGLNDSVYFDTSGDVEVTITVGIPYLGGAAPTGVTWTVSVDVTLSIGSKIMGTGSGSTEMDAVNDQLATERYSMEVKFKPVLASISPSDGVMNLHIKLTVEGVNEGSVLLYGQGSGQSFVKLPILAVGGNATAPGNETIGNEARNVTDVNGQTQNIETTKKTPGFEAIAIIGAVGIAAFVLRRRKC